MGDDSVDGSPNTAVCGLWLSLSALFCWCFVFLFVDGRQQWRAGCWQQSRYHSAWLSVVSTVLLTFCVSVCRQEAAMENGLFVDSSPGTTAWPVAQCVTTILETFCVSVCWWEAAVENGMLTAVQVPLCMAHSSVSVSALFCKRFVFLFVDGRQQWRVGCWQQSKYHCAWPGSPIPCGPRWRSCLLWATSTASQICRYCLGSWFLLYSI